MSDRLPSASPQATWPLMLALSGTVAVAFGVLLYAVSVLITEEAAGGTFSTTVLSFGYGGALLGAGALAPLIGKYADRHGVRSIFAVGTVAGGLGMVAMAAAREPSHVLAAFWLLIGPAGAMTFYEPAFIAIDQWFGAAHRARGLATLVVVGGLAGPVFLPLSSFLVNMFGWRTTAVVLGAMVTGVGLPAAMLVLPGPVAPSARSSSSADSSPGLHRLIRDPRFVTYTISVALMFGALQGLLLHRIAVFEAGGFAIGTAALGAAIASVLSFPGRAVSPFLADRFGGVGIQVLALLVLAASAVAAIDASRDWQLAAHFLLFGFAFGAVLPLRAAVMSDWYSGPGYGRIMGSQWLIASIAGAAGPATVGAMKDAFGGYRWPMTALAAVLVTAALLTKASATFGRLSRSG